MRTRIIPKNLWNGSSNSVRLVEYLLGYYGLFDEDVDVEPRLDIVMEFLGVSMKSREDRLWKRM